MSAHDARDDATTQRSLHRRALAIAAALLLLFIGALLGGAYWLLKTADGRDAVLAQVQKHLPQGMALQWKKIDGPLAGPLSFDELRFDYADTHFRARHVHLDFALLPLLGKRLHFDVLQVQDAALETKSGNESKPFQLPQWPDVLPSIDLPLSIQADALQVDGFKYRSDGNDVIEVEHARGGIALGDGYARLDHLEAQTDRGTFAANGNYEPGRRHATDLLATAVFPAQPGHSPARLGLIARGDEKHLRIAIGGNAPAPIRISAEVKGDRKPDWRFDASSEQFDPQLLGALAASLPLQFDLHAQGHQGATLLRGTVKQGDFIARIDPSSISIDDDKLVTVKPLVLHVYDGRVLVNGTANFKNADDPKFNFVIEAQHLRWGGDAASQSKAAKTDAVVANADLGIAGTLKHWSALGTGKLMRNDEAASLDYALRGDDKQATIDKLHANMPTGTLDAKGNVAWSPRLAWKLDAQLAGFDPGYFAPQFAGNLSGSIASDGKLRETGGVDANVHVPKLQGKLRGRALDGHGDFVVHGSDGEGALALDIGGSHVDAQGKVGATLDIDANLHPLQLSDVLPDAGGALSGTLQLRGKRDAPDINANLHGSNIAWQGYKAATLDMHGHLPWQGSGGELHALANGVDAGLPLSALQVEARGAVEDLHFSANAKSDYGTLDVAGSALQRGKDWQGALDALRLAPIKGGAWSLQQRSEFALKGNGNFSLTPLCLATRSDGGGQLCAQVDWPRQGAVAHADALPLTLLQPWLPKNSGRPINLRGNLKLDASFKPQGKAWLGELHLASSEGGLKLGYNARGELATYDNFSLDVFADPNAIHGRLGSGFHGDGYVDATFNTGWDDWSALKGDLYFHNSRLFWMELLSPDLVRPQGVLAGHVAVAGTRGKPLLSGEATMENFSGELPSLGIALVDGNGALSAQSDGSAKISANFHSKSTTNDATRGKGALNVTGSLSWLDSSAPLRFDVKGDDFLVADTTQLRAVAAPDVHVEVANNTISVSGKVTIPSANIDVEKLDQGVATSEDVVVLDPADPERTPSSRLDLSLQIELAGDDKVKLKGYGLDGALSGQMRVRSRPGQSMLANGQLDVDGRYTAYGQKLTISEGSLSWSNAPVGDPVIKLRAEREIVSTNVTAGIDVSGRASRPKAKVWSDPELPESEALSYLVLGRSLNTASSNESQQINAAHSALSAGAGLIASQLGAKIGLDDAGVLESRTLGGSVFGVGKYLSPKLYVSYGVSMVGAGSAVTLKYLMRKGFDMEVESSNVETRGSLNWRKEK